MIKVVHITTSVDGGAGIAALRLHQSMMKTNDVQSSVLQKRYESVDPKKKINHVAERSSIFYRLQRKLRLTPEYKNNKLIQKFSKNYEYEIATFPTSSYRIEDHPLVKDADIIHLHWVADFLNYPTFFKNVKQPIVWTLHDMNAFLGIFHYMGDIQTNTQYSGLENHVLLEKKQYIQVNNNIHIVTPSAWLKDISKKSLTLGKYSHSVISNGINFNDSQNKSQHEVKEVVGVNNANPTILFVSHGTEIHRKGFDLLLNSLSKLNSNNINLISVGGEKATINPNINHIHYNWVKDSASLNSLYAAADITVIPSREDNLPNVMLESFANGTPVISFANGGMAEHIITGENGILVDRIDSESLKKAIESFLSNKYTFDRDAIKQYAESHFEEKQQAQKYIDLYKEILNK